MVFATNPSDIQQYGIQQPGIEFFTTPDKCNAMATKLYEEQPTHGRYIFKCDVMMNGDDELKDRRQ